MTTFFIITPLYLPTAYLPPPARIASPSRTRPSSSTLVLSSPLLPTPTQHHPTPASTIPRQTRILCSPSGSE
ncbi:hypothetical protein Hypma_002436 [Hypsizygus marmoreus]|uniref:Uncharacterized protein n=1 Tax=Hypsizygus marmoreus TaxID=39966 RepID=A0A369J424_HYPMA|nr:hypothetical protein Hypma_002436 [Hypsizygus marmoreus]